MGLSMIIFFVAERGLWRTARAAADPTPRPLVPQEISEVYVCTCTFRVYLDGSAISALGLVVLFARLQNDAEVVVIVRGRIVDSDRFPNSTPGPGVLRSAA